MQHTRSLLTLAKVVFQLANVIHGIHCDLEDYEGYVKITFDLRQASESLYLDAHGKTAGASMILSSL